MTQHRRHVVMLAVFVAATLAAPIPSAAGVGTSCSERILTIVAHEDDDLLFTSPDLISTIRAGHCVETVFVTAGDAGRGKEWMLAREEGSRAAYETMTGVTDAQWPETTEQVSANEPATMTAPTIVRWELESNTASVTLVSLRLPDGGRGGFPLQGYQSVKKLWKAKSGRYIVNNVSGDATFTKDDVTAALLEEMTSFKPTEIRIQDLRDTPGDHDDHQYTALFAFDAHNRYTAPHRIVGYECQRS